MPATIESALWGKKDGRARLRIVAVGVAVVGVLGAPAVARAGALPRPLLDQAKADPARSFDVIVQTKTSSAAPADVAVTAITRRERNRLNDAAKEAAEATKKAADLAKKATDAAAKAATGQQKADEAAGKAALTGLVSDLAAAAKTRADADKASVKAEVAQAAAEAAQAAIVEAQAAIARAQGQLVGAIDKANREIRHQFLVISAVSGQFSGAELLQLEDSGDVVRVVPDASVHPTESNPQKWVEATQAHWYWGSSQRRQSAGLTPTIAVVDSGIDSTRVVDFGGRVLTQVDLTSGVGPNSPGDGRGHGTMVASIAAGGAEGHAGVNPDARLVSLDVIDDNGEGRTSDVIAAIDWILQNRYAFNIRVANFSLQASVESSFMFDPLSLAVERLWLNGIVVVAAAGNYANGGAASGVLYAPASDPFVITVGAVDTRGDGNLKNDAAAPWSSWGYTRDGFLKPELSAPGRYMIGAAPSASTLSHGGGQDPRLVSRGYLQLSGTSFAAPVVSAAAAALLGLHPDWTPDLVKGALMLSANELPDATFGSVGVGELDLKRAVSVGSPPNPNAALNTFLASTPSGLVFDSSKWTNAVRQSAAQATSATGSTASWSSASWSSASWSSASWSSASWSSASSSSASWSSASWSSASWSSASWSSASWSSASWTSAITGLATANNAAADGPGEG